MKRIIFGIITGLVILSGCAKTQVISQCPPFPKPADIAIDKIQGLHSTEVDTWIVSLFKLKKQLDLCQPTTK